MHIQCPYTGRDISVKNFNIHVEVNVDIITNLSSLVSMFRVKTAMQYTYSCIVPGSKISSILL